MWRGARSSLSGVLSRCARGIKAGGGALSVAEGVALDVRSGYVQFAGEMVARCHRLGLGRDRIAERLA